MGFLSDLLAFSIASQGKCKDIYDGVAFFIYNGPLQEWDKKHSDTAAIFRGDNVLVRSEEDYTPELIRHELKHSEQLHRCGGTELIYRPLVLLSMLKAKILKGDERQNPFELEAVAAEREE